MNFLRNDNILFQCWYLSYWNEVAHEWIDKIHLNISMQENFTMTFTVSDSPSFGHGIATPLHWSCGSWSLFRTKLESQHCLPLSNAFGYSSGHTERKLLWKGFKVFLTYNFPCLSRKPKARWESNGLECHRPI